jgi:WD40 repeat protein
MGHRSQVYGVTESPKDARLIASGSGDRTVKLWDLDTGRVVQTITATDQVYGLSFSPDGKRIAAPMQDGTILLSAVEGR